MANTPLVIIWQTANGTIILSQRQASGLVEPLPVTDPPRQATVALQASILSGVSPILAFDIPKNNDTVQPLVWAFGLTVPPADPSASIEQHLDAGNLSLNLTKVLADPSSESVHTSTTTTQTGAIATTVLVAHAALSAAGFLILLPLGALVARWARVFTPKWFTAHWFINVVLGIPLICVGWALGPLAVARRGMGHIVTPHQISGVVLFALYVFEVALGTVVHLRRPKDGKHHPPRNIIHVVLGLAVFGLSIYTVSAPRSLLPPKRSIGLI
ncbi:hypothetical protein BD311DRAFT_775329 [Dichomitus squalens]|uniref:Cytochrome b561 domain-containing protein n=2 Tax=Dichomitus squalens TaxID=114155 RepID=A0A4V2K1C4_9APHY|nr:hypothetical protein BD311DRAFT_775329 [Dichomitus squalens]